MSATTSCQPCCATPLSVNIPGNPGDDGNNGTNGVDAFTLTTGAPSSVPAIGSTVTLTVANSTWMIVGQIVIADLPANFKVTAVPTSASVTLEFLGYPGDVAPTTAIPTGTKISPAGMRGASTLNVLQTAAGVVLTDFMDFIEISAESQTMTLPTAVGRAGKMFTIKQTFAPSGPTTGTIIATAGGQTVDGLATFVLQAQNDFATVISNGANWDVIVKGTNHYVATAGNLAADDSMDVIETTVDNKTITLPTAVGRVGKGYSIFQSAVYGSGTVVTAAGAETIKGPASSSTSKTIAVQFGFITIVSNGANWLTLGSKLT